MGGGLSRSRDGGSDGSTEESGCLEVDGGGKVEGVSVLGGVKAGVRWALFSGEDGGLGVWESDKLHSGSELSG